MPRPPFSPLASVLRETFQQIGPCTGLDAWEEIARRLEIGARYRRANPERAKEMEIDLGSTPTHVDRHGRVRVTRACLEAALMELEQAGGIGCRNVHSSDTEQIFSWRPLPPEPPAERQGKLFE